MYATITEEGELIIFADGGIERFAIKKWLEDFNGNDKTYPVLRMSKEGEHGRTSPR